MGSKGLIKRQHVEAGAESQKNGAPQALFPGSLGSNLCDGSGENQN